MLRRRSALAGQFLGFAHENCVITHLMKKEIVFVTKSNFLIPISLQPDLITILKPIQT